MRVAFSSMAWNTGSSSPGELEMTCSTSEVAVCCSSDSRKLARARLHLVEQPHVLDRDHRLVGEGRDQLDLLVGERPHLGARQHDHADRNALAQERHAKDGAVAAKSLSFLRYYGFWDQPGHPRCELTLPSSTVRPTTDPGLGMSGCSRLYLSYSAE